MKYKQIFLILKMEQQKSHPKLSSNSQLHDYYQRLEQCKQISKDDRLLVRRCLMEEIKIFSDRKKQTAIPKKTGNFTLISILGNPDGVQVQLKLRKFVKMVKDKENIEMGRKIAMYSDKKYTIQRGSQYRSNTETIKRKQTRKNTKPKQVKISSFSSLKKMTKQKEDLPSQQQQLSCRKNHYSSFIPKIFKTQITSLDNSRTRTTANSRVLRVLKKSVSKTQLKYELSNSSFLSNLQLPGPQTSGVLSRKISEASNLSKLQKLEWKQFIRTSNSQQFTNFQRECSHDIL